MVHAMEASEGFAAIILVGSTKLTSLITTRTLSPLATRIGTHVHLLALDLDESIELLEGRGGLGKTHRTAIEGLHRDARGNPRLLLRLLRKMAWTGADSGVRSQPASHRKLPEPPKQQIMAYSVGVAAGTTSAPTLATQDVDRRTPANAANDESVPLAPALVPSRPPLRVEEGLIEVGWEGNLESEAAIPADEAVASVAPGLSPGPVDELSMETIEQPAQEILSEEMIEDHYAALQAWTEWAQNRDRASKSERGAGFQGAERNEVLPATLSQGFDEQGGAEVSTASGLRAESQHEHAPYSQLFSRLRQSR